VKIARSTRSGCFGAVNSRSQVATQSTSAIGQGRASGRALG
jgi:hypothetical protein